MKKLMQLLEMKQGSLELKKGTSDSEIKKYTAKGIDVQLVDPSTENLEENESPYEYSKIDSAALGQKVLRTLVATLKAQGDEIHKTPEGKPDVKLKAGVNRFSIEVDYGDNVLAKNDTFKFTIDPRQGKLMFKLGNKNLPLVNIDVTDGNNDSLNDTLLQKNLGLVLKKLKTEPNVKIPGEEPVVEPQPLDTEIQEKLDPVGKEDDDINNDGEVNSSDKYLAKRRQAVSKNIEEDLDIGHQDDEPGMLKGDVYKIAKNAVELYKTLGAFQGHGEVDFPHWWQSKIVRAADDLQCAKEYLEFETREPAIDAAINTLGEATTATVPGDVAALGKAQTSSTTVQAKSKNINNMTEFPGAFENWMSGLGLVPGKDSRGTLESAIRKVLVNLGYK